MNAMLTLSSRPRSSWRRAALALLAVPAILIGLIAMHLLASDALAPENHPMSVSVADGSALLVSQDETLAPQGCDEMCAPMDDMLGMACVLALLVSAVLLVLRVIFSRSHTVGSALRPRMARISALAPPPPPSLHVLSISRT